MPKQKEIKDKTQTQEIRINNPLLKDKIEKIKVLVSEIGECKEDRNISSFAQLRQKINLQEELIDTAFPNTLVTINNSGVEEVDIIQLVAKTIGLIDYLLYNIEGYNEEKKKSDEYIAYLLKKHKLTAMYGPFNNRLMEMMSIEINILAVSSSNIKYRGWLNDSINLRHMKNSTVVESISKNYERAISWANAVMLTPQNMNTEIMCRETLNWVKHALQIGPSEKYSAMLTSSMMLVISKLAEINEQKKNFKEAVELRIQELSMAKSPVIHGTINRIDVLTEKYLKYLTTPEKEKDEEIMNKILEIPTIHLFNVVGEFHKRIKELEKSPDTEQNKKGDLIEINPLYEDALAYTKGLWNTIYDYAKEIGNNEVKKLAKSQLKSLGIEIIDYNEEQ